QLREIGHDVVADVATAADGIAVLKICQPDLAILDLDLGPGPTGVDLAYAIRKAMPRVGILMLSTYVDIRLIGDFRPLPAGAVFMVKRSLTDTAALDSAMTMAVLREPVRPADPGALGMPRLRDGQLEIMRLIAYGYTNAEIARKRSLEEASVAKAIARLLQQLGLTVTPERNVRVLITQAYFALLSGPGTSRT
ncbi:MAG: LuxR C-terminal-related transcriptional regulator, partial [Candidatus Nanopelagicales bacterium]|nr:LuxR C-terminal-related transcriptional regulator [Candidatus Nanopelagicales bacterium]